MGDMKIFSGSVLSGCFVGSSEIQKIYVGNVKVYEKYVPPVGTTVNYATNLESGISSAHYHCSTDQTIPYTFSGTTSIRVAPNDFSRLAHGTCTYFAYFHVGTSDSYNSADIINYNFEDHINTFVTGYSGSLVSFDDTYTNVYATFVYKQVSYNPDTDGFFTVSLSRTKTSASTTINLNTHLGSIFPSSGTYPTLEGRTIVICGYFGSGSSVNTNVDHYFEEEVTLSARGEVASASITEHRVTITFSLMYVRNYNFSFTGGITVGSTIQLHVRIDKILIK